MKFLISTLITITLAISFSVQASSHNFIELGTRSSSILDDQRYGATLTFGTFRYKRLEYQITSGLLFGEGTTVHSDGKQLAKKLAYVGPRLTYLFKLTHRLRLEPSIALTIGHLYYSESKGTSSSWSEGPFIGILPSINIVYKMSGRWRLLFGTSFLTTSKDTRSGALVIGPALDVSARFNY